MTCVSTEGGSCKIEVRKDPFYFDVSPRCCGGGAATDAVKCPAPQNSKGTIAAGSKFTVEWPARNHATPSQNPDGGITKGVSIYLASKTATTLGDFCGSTTVNENCPQKICDASYGPSTCGGTNGDNIPCTTECTMPADKAAGDYSLLWLWDWRQNDGSMYSACGDITVSAASNAPAPTASPATNAPTTLAPTAPGATRPPTPPVGDQNPNSCDGDVGSQNLLDNEIRFINVPRVIPYKSCALFLQEVYYRKDSNTLGVLVIDMVDGNGEWHGKGIEIIPGESTARTTVVMHVWQGKSMIAANGTMKFKAYFVEKSSYDRQYAEGTYYKDKLAEDTTVETKFAVCPGCGYSRNCGADTASSTVPTCATQDELDRCGLNTPSECPVDGNMKPKPVTFSNDNSSPINNFGIGIFFSALFALYSL